MADPIEIGKRIKYARELKDITQEQLGNEIGLNKSTIQRYETGQVSKIKIPVLESIAKSLNVKPEWLALKSDDISTPQNIDNSPKNSDLGNKSIMAQNIKYYMDLNSVNQTEICNKLNLKTTTFSDWVNAKTYPQIDKIELLANYFGIEKSDLIEKHTKNNDNEKRLLLLARHLEKIPEDKRNRIIKNFEDTIDTYLDAMGIKKED